MATATTKGAEGLVRDYAAYLDGDVSKGSVLAEAFRFHGPGLPDEGIQGREAYKAFLKAHVDAFPDLKHRIDTLVASDRLVMAEYTVTGTHKGAFNGIPPTGRRITMKTAGAYVVADGKIQEERAYYDVQTLLQQLGVKGA